LLREEHNIDFTSKKIGIVGVGAVGSAVLSLLNAFDCSVVLYDPPREEREANFKSASKEDVLACDILTFHVPLNEQGEHPTLHWLSKQELINQSFEVIINAARGGVVHEEAVLEAFEQGDVSHLITDVWEDEPDFNTELAHHSFISH
jgi:erythronate-4-phosphate dehydrogenase